VGSEKTLHALDGRTGAQAWELTSPGEEFKNAPVNGGNGMLYIHNEFTNMVYNLKVQKLDAVVAVNEETGAVHKVTRFDRYGGHLYVESPLICADGNVCLQGVSGREITCLRPPDSSVNNNDTAGEIEAGEVDMSDEWLTIDDVRIRRNAMSHMAVKNW